MGGCLCCGRPSFLREVLQLNKSDATKGNMMTDEGHDQTSQTHSDTNARDDVEQRELAARLREAREYVGLLQEDVARALGIPRASVSALESGKRRVSSLELRRLARLYRRSVAWLLGEDHEIDTSAPLFRATAALSDNDKEQVLRFAEFLAGAGQPGASRQDDGA